MEIDDILFSKFSAPARIFSFKNSVLTTLKINSKFLPEYGMNIDEKDYVSANSLEAFDSYGLSGYLSAIEKCINEGESTCESWQRLISSCCGTDKICIRSRFILLEKNENGATIYESIRNITSEKRHLEALKESERRFKIASEQINIYYWEYTVATKEMRPCFRCMRDLGLPALVENYPEPAIEMGIFPPDYADMYRDWHRQIENGVKELEADIPLTVGRVPFRVKYTTEFDENGKPVKAYGSATYITDTEKNQLRLDHSIIESLAEEFSAIYLIDLNTNIAKIIKSSFSSGSADSSVSYTDFISKVLDRYIEEYSEDSYKFKDLEYLKHDLFKNNYTREFNFKNKENGKWLRILMHKVEELDGEVVKLLVTAETIEDLRAQKIDDDRLIALQKKELEEREAQLVLAVEAANRANNAKSDFLARMSHEIRTPMNAIMGMNEIILKTSTDQAISEYAGDAYRAASSLLGIINEILDFSKIESGKMELCNDTFPLGNFFGNLYTLFALRAEDKNLALIFNVDSSLPSTVVADETRLRQILTNLLSNAVKYTEKGTITFNARCVERTAGYADIFFEVKDTGKGIKEEDFPKLFEAFGRIDAKSNKNIEGTGLGMSIVSRLIEMMDSKLKVSSEFGVGSSFSFIVRFSSDCNEDLGDYRLSMNNTSIEKDSEHFADPSKKILIVDDNAVNLKVIKALLRSSQAETDTAISGAKALEMTLLKEYDLIFLDHYMPEMDGFETLNLIKTQIDGKNKKTPIIALTANAIKGVNKEYLARGFTDVVFKPTTQKELTKILIKYLT